MRVACYTKVDDTDAAKVYECTGFEHNSHNGYQHEVILHHAKVVEGAAAPDEQKTKRHVLIEIDGGDRQAAGAYRCARVVIEADEDRAFSAPIPEAGPVYEKAIDGRAGVKPSAPALHETGPVVVEQADADAAANVSGQVNNDSTAGATEQQP
jgi:hypothetical protein